VYNPLNRGAVVDVGVVSQLLPLCGKPASFGSLCHSACNFWVPIDIRTHEPASAHSGCSPGKSVGDAFGVVLKLAIFG
jgi:hypothetical protein